MLPLMLDMTSAPVQCCIEGTLRHIACAERLAKTLLSKLRRFQMLLLMLSVEQMRPDTVQMLPNKGSGRVWPALAQGSSAAGSASGQRLPSCTSRC